MPTWTLGQDKLSLFKVGDRVKVIATDNYGKFGTVITFTSNRRDMAIRLDGQGPEEDFDVYKPEELAKV